MKFKILMLAVLVLMGTIGALFYSGHLWFSSPSFKEFPIQGLDISHHQGEIDWKKLKTERYKFVYIKATEGEDFKDPRFKSNWKMARKNGLRVGAYHFFTLCKTGLSQAKNFIETVSVETSSLPPAIDLEFDGNCKRRPSVDELHSDVLEFANLIESHFKTHPILYVTYEFYDAYFKDKELPYPFWIRDIFGRPRVNEPSNWLFWQYSNRGRVQGFNTFVDLNVFNGKSDAFRHLKESRF